MIMMMMTMTFRLKSVTSFRARLQYRAPSNYVRQLAKLHRTINGDRRAGRFHRIRRLTLPITARDLRLVPDLSSSVSAAEIPAGPLRSVSGQSDLRVAGLQELDEGELWLARTLAGQVPSSSDDQTSKDDTEDELSK